MARVLVTGAAGFIGSHLSESCLALGHEVVGIDALTDYYDPDAKRENLRELDSNPRFTFLSSDLNEAELGDVLEGAQIVFHLAAQPGVRASWGETFDAYVSSNVSALQRLLEACRGVGLDRFVFASSSSVYGNAETLPADETTPLQPISPYGATKVLGEHLCRLYHRSFGVPTVLLRYFTVFGPRQRPDMAFNRLIRAALSDDEIVIYGDGEQTRDFTYVQDAVAATISAARQGSPGTVYNIGGGNRCSMNMVLELLSEITGANLNVQRINAQAGDARDTAADTRRAREQLGYMPANSLRDGLRRQVAWHRREDLAIPAGAAYSAAPELLRQVP